MRALFLVLCIGVLAETAWAEDLNPRERHLVEIAFLEGNVEHLASIEPHAATPEDRLPFAVRDLYWRPDPTAQARYDDVAAQAKGLVGERYAWLLSNQPRGAYPMPGAGEEIDPWPMLSALIEDRILREATGRDGLPERSPVTKLAAILHSVDQAGRLDDDTRIRLEYLDHQRDDLSGVVLGFERNEQEIEDAEIAAEIKRRNSILAALALVALVALTVLVGLRSKATKDD